MRLQPCSLNSCSSRLEPTRAALAPVLQARSVIIDMEEGVINEMLKVAGASRWRVCMHAGAPRCSGCTLGTSTA
jgi:hypothetical protein